MKVSFQRVDGRLSILRLVLKQASRNLILQTMKRPIYAFVFLSLVSSTSLTQGENFQVKFSEPFAVFQFVDNLSADAPPNVFKTIFDESKFNLDQYNNLIAEYEHLNVDYGYEYTNYPYAQKIGGSTGSLLKRNLINSSSINEFKLISLGIIPNADLFKLCDLLIAFEPVYQELIYYPFKGQFEQQLNTINKLIEKDGLGLFFDTGLRFYHSSWDEHIPFTIAIYPLPGTLHFTATAFYNNAVVAVPVGLQDYNKLLSVMIHEVFHILYDEESVDFKKRIEDAFINNPSPNSRYAYLLLNEALATSLGNGYVYGQLHGAEDTAVWYRRKYTNLIAKKIYPLVKAYIISGKALDKDFIDQFIQVFDYNFSGWLKEKDFILTDRYVIADNADNFNIIDQTYPYRSMSAYDTQVTISSIEKMKRAPITKVVIVSKSNSRELSLLKKQFKELKNWQPDSRADFSYTVFLADKTYLIILNNVRKDIGNQLESLTIQ
jgi:hypothetical protein